MLGKLVVHVNEFVSEGSLGQDETKGFRQTSHGQCITNSKDVFVVNLITEAYSGFNTN